MTPTTLKHDGLDALRAALSPLVALDVTQDFSDTITITLTIPDPIPFHPCILTRWFFDTTWQRQYVYADSCRRIVPPAYAPTLLSLEEWGQDIRERAAQMLARAQADPVAFFVSDAVADLKS